MHVRLPPVHSPTEFLNYMLFVLQNGVSGLMGILTVDLPSDVSVAIGGVLVGTQSLLQLVRQWRGLWPNPNVFPPVLPVTWHWTLISRDIGSCPSGNPVPKVNLNPVLGVANMPVYGIRTPALNALDYPSLTEPNSTMIRLQWWNSSSHGTLPIPSASFLLTPLNGLADTNVYTGPFHQVPNTTAKNPTHALFLAQSHVLTVPLRSVNVQARTASIVLPLQREVIDSLYDQSVSVVNGTVFIALVDDDSNYCLTNLSRVYAHTFAGPTLYRAG